MRNLFSLVTLKQAFLTNAAFSTISGFTMALAAIPLTHHMGIQNSGEFRIVGINLLVFATFVFWLAHRTPIPRPLAWAVVAGDIAWVLASFAGLLWLNHNLTTLGLFLVIDVAIVVAALAALQVFCLLRQVGRPASR